MKEQTITMNMINKIVSKDVRLLGLAITLMFKNERYMELATKKTEDFTIDDKQEMRSIADACLQEVYYLQER